VGSITNFLDEAILNCVECDLHKESINKELGKVLGIGSETKIMLVGINPSIKRTIEDKYNMRPDLTFSNTPRGMLSKVLHEVELPYESMYVTNLLKCSTADNSEPTEEQIKKCFNNIFLQEFIALEIPEHVICLGNLVYEFLNENLAKFKRTQVYKVYHHSYIANRAPDKYEEWKNQFLRIKGNICLT
jgi:uracil-DNA glycosylase family 4